MQQEPGGARRDTSSTVAPRRAVAYSHRRGLVNNAVVGAADEPSITACNSLLSWWMVLCGGINMIYAPLASSRRCCSLSHWEGQSALAISLSSRIFGGCATCGWLGPSTQVLHHVTATAAGQHADNRRQHNLWSLAPCMYAAPLHCREHGAHNAAPHTSLHQSCVVARRCVAPDWAPAQRVSPRPGESDTILKKPLKIPEGRGEGWHSAH